MDGHRARGGGGDQLVLAQPAILGVGPLLEIADWDVMMLARFGQSNSPTGNSNITRVPPGGKANIAPPAKATWFKIVAVPCANGEHTPTVESWTYPNAFDAVTPEHVHRVRTMA